MRACGREKSEALGTRIAERVSCEGRLVVHVRGCDLTRPPEVQRGGGGGQVTNPRSRTASARGLAGGAGLAHGSSPTRATAQGRPWTTSGAAGAPPSPPGGATAGGGGGQVTNPHSRTAAARGLAGGAGLVHGSAPTRATAQERPWTTSGAATARVGSSSGEVTKTGNL